MFNGLLGSHDGVLRWADGLLLWLNLGHQNVTMLLCIYPMTRIFSGQNGPVDSLAVLTSTPGLQRFGIPFPSFQKFDQGFSRSGVRKWADHVCGLGVAQEHGCVGSVFVMDLLCIHGVASKAKTIAVTG